jgi:hypothetical protein
MQDAPDISSPSDGPSSSRVHSSDDRRTLRTAAGASIVARDT